MLKRSMSRVMNVMSASHWRPAADIRQDARLSPLFGRVLLKWMEGRKIIEGKPDDQLAPNQRRFGTRLYRLKS
jgi:hypothetical protein